MKRQKEKLVTKHNHKQSYQKTQPGKLKALYPGMIAEFVYSGDKIFDKKPLILVVYNEVYMGGDLVHGINLNYLPESQVQKLFCSCELLHKGASVYSKEPIKRTVQSQMGDYDDTLPNRNLLKEEFTRIMLPTYKEKRGTNPLSQSEAKRQMKMLYEKVLKKFINKFDIYRSYKTSKMKTIKVVKYNLGNWHQPGV